MQRGGEVRAGQFSFPGGRAKISVAEATSSVGNFDVLLLTFLIDMIMTFILQQFRNASHA